MKPPPIYPVRRIGRDERLDGEQYEIDGYAAWRITAHSADGRSATFWALRKKGFGNRTYPWVTCAGLESGSYYSQHKDFESAARSAGIRARKWLNAGRRMGRARKGASLNAT